MLPKPSPGRTIILTIKDVPSDPLSESEGGGGFFRIFLLMVVLYFFFRTFFYDVPNEESTKRSVQPNTETVSKMATRRGVRG